ncbi:unnamed protein product [Ceratitis capitata]|uniref:(Mediterranean fruit fly) hypothetical protein n=1 Tax=Ceratitis capitata TaxID=7213 RepID=A0A811UFW6_CERCA|nr:unnamed protein product [Ceratitis capitata]
MRPTVQHHPKHAEKAERKTFIVHIGAKKSMSKSLKIEHANRTADGKKHCQISFFFCFGITKLAKLSANRRLAFTVNLLRANKGGEQTKKKLYTYICIYYCGQKVR